MLLSTGLLILAGAACWLGMALLALSQPRNWRALRLSGEIRPYARPLGWGLVALSLGLTWLRDGLNFAILIWPMFIAVSALCIALLLAHRPGFLRGVAKPLQTEG
ncbi:MAG: DUF3325 family protein [Pseudomonadota bacterium]